MWEDNFRRSLKDFLLSESTIPDVRALVQNIDSILSRLSPRTKKDQRNIEVARHNLKQIEKKYKRELSELKDIKEQLEEIRLNEE